MITTLEAPASWSRIDFVSDVHLAPTAPRTHAAWAGYLRRTPADAVFLLGDLFDAWVGDDARDDPFEAACVAVLRDASRTRRLWFMAGNRDFLLGDAMCDACGMTRLDDPTCLAAFGERALLTHGDAWCLADTDYLRFRREVRSPAWQAAVLARPLAQRRQMASALRSESERQAGLHQGPWADVDAATALDAMARCGASVLIHGHTHRPATAPLGPARVRHVLTDWDLDHDHDHDPLQGPAHPRSGVLRWQRAPDATGHWLRLGLGAAAEPAR